MADQQQQQPRVKVSGLWTNKTRSGDTYLSGSNGSVRYSIWPNGYAKGESDPSHVLYIEAVAKRPEEDAI
jgi:hypothetical protein